MNLPQPAKLGSIAAIFWSLLWKYLPPAFACQISIKAPSIGFKNWSLIVPWTIILCPIGDALFWEKFNVKSLSNFLIIFLLNIGPETSDGEDGKKTLSFLGALRIDDL